MNSFEFHTTRSVIVECGGARRLPQRIAVGGWQRILVVTDAALLEAGLLAEFLAGLSAYRIDCELFSGVVADPPEEVVEAAVEQARRAGVQAVVGFGGGSSMDVAKLAALRVGSNELLSSLYGVGLATGPRLPLILIPTTAGTGSEVTPISVVTTEAGEKRAVSSPLLLPDLALLDAELTIGLPPAVTAATGIDAMVHAIEAFTCIRSKNPISDCMARDALRLLSGSLHAACRNGSDLAARENMLLGACLAGIAFANAPVAAVHALAYPIGARFHVPHGLSNSLVLGPVLQYNLPFVMQHYATLCDMVLPGMGGTEEVKACALVDYFASLSGQLGLPTRLRDVGIRPPDVPMLANDAMRQTRLLVNNPREVTFEDAVAIYEKVL